MSSKHPLLPADHRLRLDPSLPKDIPPGGAEIQATITPYSEQRSSRKPFEGLAGSLSRCLATLLVLTTGVFALSIPACLGGQKPLPPPPTQLTALPDTWKEMVFKERTKGGKEENWQKNSRFLFLDPPVPCTVRIGKKGFLAFGSEIKQGYGGVFLEKTIAGSFFGKRKGVDKDATLYFYLIDADSGAVSIYSREQLEHARVEPPIITVETIYLHNGRRIEMKAGIHDPVLRMEAVMFRAIPDVETFDKWPPYI